MNWAIEQFWTILSTLRLIGSVGMQIRLGCTRLYYCSLLDHHPTYKCMHLLRNGIRFTLIKFIDCFPWIWRGKSWTRKRRNTGTTHESVHFSLIAPIFPVESAHTIIYLPFFFSSPITTTSYGRPKIVRFVSFNFRPELEPSLMKPSSAKLVLSPVVCKDIQPRPQYNVRHIRQWHTSTG